jgi:hypothetical protein
MALDVAVPEQPDLTNRGLPSELEAASVIEGESELRRQELEDILREGAWEEAFREWAEYTDLTEAEFRTVRDAGLFEGLDFYWDPTEATIRFEVPALPESWAGDDFASRVETELTDLCETVHEMLDSGYIDWDADGTLDDPWVEETFDDRE